MTARRAWHRASALGLLFTAVLVMAVVIALPLRVRLAEHEQIVDRAQAILLRHGGLVASRPELDRLWQQIITESKANLYLDGENGDLAGAILQERIRRIVQTHGGAIQSVQTLSRSDERDDEVTVRVQCTLAYKAAYQLLRDLEDASPPLVLDRLQLRILRDARQTRSGEWLDATADIVGFLPKIDR